MNDGYGQAYQSMYTGSMVGSGAVVFAVWGYVISNTDSRTSMVRLNETVISTIIGESVDVITKAIAVLCAPDPRSHRKAEGGRRLIKQGEWDYFVVNFEHYHGLAKREKRKKYMADLMAKKRAKEKENANIVLTDDNCAMSSLDASLSDLSKKGDSKGGIRFPEFWKAWPAHPRKANKKACLKLWKAQALDNLADTIITAVEKFKLCEDWTKEDRQFIPAPLVWLRQERWEAAGYIGNRSGVEDTPEIIEYAKQVRQKVERENGRDIGRLYHKIRDAIGQQAFNRVKQLALEKGGRG